MPEEVDGWSMGRFIVSWLAIVGGLLGGLGIALLLQQYAVFPLSIGLLVTGAVVGLAVGLVMPSLLFMVMSRGKEATT